MYPAERIVEIFLPDKYVTLKFNNFKLPFTTLINFISNIKKKASEMNAHSINLFTDISEISKT